MANKVGAFELSVFASEVLLYEADLKTLVGINGDIPVQACCVNVLRKLSVLTVNASTTGFGAYDFYQTCSAH